MKHHYADCKAYAFVYMCNQHFCISQILEKRQIKVNDIDAMFNLDNLFLSFLRMFDAVRNDSQYHDMR